MPIVLALILLSQLFNLAQASHRPADSAHDSLDAEHEGWFGIDRDKKAEKPVSAGDSPLVTGTSQSLGTTATAPGAPPGAFSALAQTRNVDMFHGELKVMGPVDVNRIAVGNGQIIRAEVLETQELMVIAESPGSTSLRLWHTDGSQSDFNIRVSESDPETRFRVERSVRMKVRMVEFRKSALSKLGIDWSDSVAGPQFATVGDLVTNNLYRPGSEVIATTLPNAVRPFASFVGLASSITSRINLLASNGDATTLAEPVLSCANGESASFLAGGEVPYPTTNENGQTQVQFKEYGIKLDISPRIDQAGNVKTVIDTEISQLDPAVSVQGTPGLLTRRVRTAVNARSGETIIISGLLSSESSKDADRLPGLGRLPIIGTFFKSRSNRQSVTELVIFVTPEVIEPTGTAVAEADPEIQSWLGGDSSPTRRLMSTLR